MRGIRMERRLIQYLRSMGAVIYSNETLDHQKIDFVFAGLMSNGGGCADISREIAIQLTTAPTNISKFEKFVAISSSSSFPYEKKLYIAMPPRGMAGDKVLAIIFSILVSMQYNREDETSSKDKVACLIFADCTYAFTSAEGYKEMVYREYNLIDGVDTRNFIPLGTTLTGTVFATAYQMDNGYMFVNAGGQRFFVHKQDQNKNIWDLIQEKILAKEEVRVQFVVMDYAPQVGEGQRVYIQVIA